MDHIVNYIFRKKVKAIFRRKRWLSFEYSSAFPKGKPLSAWISTLALITNELIVVNKSLFAQYSNLRLKGSHEVPYYLWLACSHYREAAKFYGQSQKSPQIQRFMKTLPESILETYSEFESTFEPYKGSFVEVAIKPIRDSFFHYRDIDSQLWIPLLGELEDEMGEFSMQGDGLDFTRWEFAEHIRINMIQTVLENTSYTIEEVVETLGTSIVSMITFGQNVVTEYFATDSTGTLYRGRANSHQKGNRE